MMSHGPSEKACEILTFFFENLKLSSSIGKTVVYQVFKQILLRPLMKTLMTILIHYDLNINIFKTIVRRILNAEVSIV